MVENSYPFECQNNQKWVYPCQTFGDTLNGGMYGMPGEWYICDGTGYMQCNKYNANYHIITADKSYICSSEKGWLLEEIDLGLLPGNPVDQDNDGVSDYFPDGSIKDKCIKANYECEVYDETNAPSTSLIGCQIDPDCRSICQDYPGATGGVDGPLNIHIIITPCNFGAAQNSFDYYADILAEKMTISTRDQAQEPFISNTNKFKITKIWENYPGVRQANGWVSCNEDLMVAAREKCMIAKEKTIFVQLIAGEFLSGGCHVGQDSNGVHYGDCNVNLNYMDSTGYISYVSHEIGHAFRLGHSFYTNRWNVQTKNYGQTDYPPSVPEFQIPADFYIPDIPFSINPLSGEINYQPCPLWDIQEFHKWVLPTEENVHCFPFYDSYAGQYRPWLQFDLMAYEWQPAVQKFNPVGRKLISDVLNGNYQEYLNRKYPHRCSEIDDEFLKTFDEPIALSSTQLREECLVKECHMIPLDHTDNSGVYYYDGIPYTDYLNYMGLKTGMPASTSREACCNQITDIAAKEACKTQN